MAAISITKNAILSFSKSSQPFPLRPRVSRVCFTSAASRYQQMKEETSDAAKSKAEQINDKSKEKLGSMADKAYQVREKTKKHVQGAKETTKGAAEKVAEAAKQTVQKIKETVVGKSADEYTREEGKRVVDQQRRRQDQQL